jgi:CRP/FNR family transcriptional regulator, cyclic AMP receptor protein
MARETRLRLTPAAFLERAGPGRTTQIYDDKEVVYSQGQPADRVYYLRSGTVILTVVSKRRRRKAVLAVLQKGDFFGEGCLGRQAQRTSTATSFGRSTVTGIAKNVFRKKLYADPVFAARFITCLLSQTARLKADLADHFLNFSERRLARILLEHKGFVRKAKNGAVTVSQTTLAQMVGTTRGRVSFFMNEFRKKGYVRYNGSLEINPQRLTAFLKG